MADFKKETAKNATFAEGGHSNHMFGEQVAGSQKPQVTHHSVSDSEGAKDEYGTGGSVGDKFAKGGSTKMFSFAPSVPAKAGITSAR